MAKATTVAPMPVPEKTVDVPATAPAKKKPSPSSEDKRGSSRGGRHQEAK
jgi:hypothetical protein